MEPDRCAYDRLWKNAAENQSNDISLLAEVATRHSHIKVLQPSNPFERLVRLAVTLNEWYQCVVETWASHLGVRNVRGKVKSWPRACEKANRSYKGNFLKVLDFVRASLVTETVADAVRVLRFVVDNASVHTIKNRYSLKYDAKSTGGYRDLNLQLTFKQLEGTPFEGFVVELQIILAEFLKVKSDEGHRRYIACRNLRGD